MWCRRWLGWCLTQTSLKVVSTRHCDSSVKCRRLWRRASWSTRMSTALRPRTLNLTTRSSMYVSISTTPTTRTLCPTRTRGQALWSDARPARGTGSVTSVRSHHLSQSRVHLVVYDARFILVNNGISSETSCLVC